MFIDLAKIEALMAEERYSENLSNKGDSHAELLSSKVAGAKHALGIGPLSDDYSANVGAGNASINNELAPLDPFNSNLELQGTGAPGTPNGKIIWDYLTREQSFTPEGAAGIIGNLMQESNLDPNKYQGGGGPGRGIMQWTVNERWASLLSWAQEQNRSPWHLRTQLDYMILEMKKTKSGGKSVYSYFQTIKGIKESTDFFEKTMERAGKPLMEKRYKYAFDAFRNYSNWGTDSRGNPTFKDRSQKYWEDKYG